MRPRLSPQHLAGAGRIGEMCWDEYSGALLWQQSHSGQSTLWVSSATGDAPQQVAMGLSARGKIGYGGGDFSVADHHVYYCCAQTKQIQKICLKTRVRTTLTTPANLLAAPQSIHRGRWLVYLQQDEAGLQSLAVVAKDGKSSPKTLTSRHDFYTQPRLSHDERWLSFIAWDNPAMPWDSSYLYLAALHTNAAGLPELGEIRRIAGSADGAITQAEFDTHSGSIYYIDDQSGWGQLWRYDIASGATAQITATTIEMGFPAWQQEMRSFTLAPDGAHAYVIASTLAATQLLKVTLATGAITEVESLSSYTGMTNISMSARGQIALRASSQQNGDRLVCLLPERATPMIIARATAEDLPPASLSLGERVQWESAGTTVHGIYNPPCGRAGTHPPAMVVLVHSGPTAQARLAWAGDVQYLCGLGYAVLQVNYRGSTGYGRNYMTALRGQWGTLDLADVLSGTEKMVQRGYADRTRLAIMGSSAGGYTALRALTEAPEVFAAGISAYGVTSLMPSATHKFEAFYNDSLVAPAAGNEALLRERSPLFGVARIQRPVLLFQGSDDEVVLPEQAEAIVAALQAQGVAHVYRLYEGEGHGFRQRLNVEDYYETIAQFLAQHLPSGTIGDDASRGMNV